MSVHHFDAYRTSTLRLRDRRTEPRAAWRSFPVEQPASRKSRPVREWVGGRVPAPFFVQDCDESYRPDIVVWMELPDHLVVGQAVLDPDDNHRTVARILRNAILNPNVGEPRQPDAIRVADHDLANEVRAEVAGIIPVTVAPTPELDELFQILIASMPVPGEDEPSYFAHGRVCPDAVELLFTASGFLFAVTPWDIADDNQLLRMDIPALGIDGACLSIIGQLGQSRGVLIFPSRKDFERFLEAAANSDPEQPGPGAFGAEVLSLTFHNATQLPPAMRREAMHNGWPVDSPDAYPVVARRDPDGIPRPLVDRDVETVAACALALAAFLPKHAAIFKADTLHSGLRVVLRRRRPRGPLHRALRGGRPLRRRRVRGARTRHLTVDPDSRKVVPRVMMASRSPPAHAAWG